MNTIDEVPRTDQLLICCLLQDRTGYRLFALMQTT